MCAEYRPPVTTSGKPQAVGGVRKSLLGTTRRRDGRTQLTYNGHPLYTFIMDKKAGDTKGEAVTGFGGRWDPVSAAGRAVTKESVSKQSYQSPVKISAITPGPGDVAGAGGVFNIDLSLEAQNAQRNALLSAANGYVRSSTTTARRPSARARSIRARPGSSSRSRRRPRRLAARRPTWPACSS
jgi:Secreted repeat of unknown function